MENIDYENFAGIEIERKIVVNQPADVLYQFWRGLDKLPGIMGGLKSITVLDQKRSHWVIVGPLGKNIEWDSELAEDVPNRQLGWRTVGKSDVHSTGAIEFSPCPDGRSTEVKLRLKYAPPGGRLGFALAKLFERKPVQQVEESMREFKKRMENSWGRSTPEDDICISAYSCCAAVEK